MPSEAEIHLSRASAKLRAAVRGEISSAAGEVKTFEPEDLVRDLKANGLDILKLHVLDLGIQRLDLADTFKSRGVRSGPRTWRVPSIVEWPVIFPGK